MPNIVETSDAAANTGTTYTLQAGQTARGNLSGSGDHDWYRVTLTAGQTYSFAMTGTGSLNVQNPFLRLYDTSGATIVASNDNGLQGQNSVFTYTVATSGDYFLDAAATTVSDAGQYGISFTAGARPSFDTQMAAGVIDTDQAWTATQGTGVTVTYGFRDTLATYTGGDPEALATFTQLSATEIAAVRAALAAWSEVSGIVFQEVNPGGYTDNATMLFSNYNSTTDGAGAYASYPTTTAATDEGGDVWLNTNSIPTGSAINPGSYAYFALMHEIGHAIGLSHPGQYNAGPGVVITYAANAQFAQDSQQYSVMSYFGQNATGATNSAYVRTAQLADIQAVQQIYGVNNTTRSGDTIYGFGATAGALYDFSANPLAGFSIWDAGGTDTINASGFAQNQRINLNQESFSDVGGMISNFSIALGAVIENATGGSGADQIAGNAGANTIDGGGGADTIYGGGGADNVLGGGSADLIYGDSGPDLGGVTGVGSGSGLVTTTPGTSRATALSLANTFSLVSNPDIVNSTTDQHTTARYTTPASGTVIAGYYSISLAANVTVTLDIDHTTGDLDSWIRFYDSAGAVLAENDDAGNDPGSAISQDSGLAYSTTAAGTYYVSVGQWNTVYDDTLPNNVSYDLNISVASRKPIVQDVTGAAGDDTLDGGAGADTLNGGGGINTASYASALSAVRAVLFDATNNTGDAGGDVYVSIQNLLGSASGDSLFGDSGDNLLDGAGGSDALYGMDGNDTLIGGAAGAGGYNQLLGGNGNDTASYVSETLVVTADLGGFYGYVGGVAGANLRDIFNSIENLIGGSANDTLIGDGAGNLLTGGAGSDVLFGQGGADTLMGGASAPGGYNQLFGGSGLDTASYAGETGAVTADLQGFYAYVGGVAASNLRDIYNSIENVTGGSVADVLFGDGNANVIEGGAGADQLYGRGGADTFVYRAFADSNVGGGYDTIADFVAGTDKIDLRAFLTDAAHVQIISGSGATKLLVEATPGTFNAATDLAVAFIGAGVLTTADILF